MKKLLFLLAIGTAGYFSYKYLEQNDWKLPEDLTNLIGTKSAVAATPETAAPASAPAAPASQPAAPVVASTPPVSGAPVQPVSLNSVPPAPTADVSPEPAATAPAATPKPAKYETIRLKNGKSINGTIVVRDGTVIWVRGVDGKTTEVREVDIAK